MGVLVDCLFVWACFLRTRFLCFLVVYRCFGYVSDLKEGWGFDLGTRCAGCVSFVSNVRSVVEERG